MIHRLSGIGIAGLLAAGSAWTASLSAQPAQAALTTPIHHIVVIDMENHTFDNVLGGLCATRCDGARQGRLPDGSVITLAPATDIVPNVAHNHASQVRAIDGGRMDGFADNVGCGATSNYACYSQFSSSQIPNLARLFGSFAVSDKTFELDTAPSWGSHLELVASRLDGFLGDNPQPGTSTLTGPGWGCDSYKDATWVPPTGGLPIKVPSCIPRQDGTGPYRPSPVRWTPTIMDRLSNAGRSWRLYVPGSSSTSAYGWAICPTFADCLYTARSANMVPTGQVLTDASSGHLPAFAIVTPGAADSEHNSDSMLTGDNWLGGVVGAIENGPQWSSTAVFITYDDCGCFYDHVPPPAGLGIRVPMVIVSPYARAGFTDSNIASFDSILAYTEHTFGLSPLSSRDGGAYNYSASFDYAQSPLRPVPLAQSAVPALAGPPPGSSPAGTDPT